MKQHGEPEVLGSPLSDYGVCLKEISINLAEWALLSQSQRLNH